MPPTLEVTCAFAGFSGHLRTCAVKARIPMAPTPAYARLRELGWGFVLDGRPDYRGTLNPERAHELAMCPGCYCLWVSFWGTQSDMSQRRAVEWLRATNATRQVSLELVQPDGHGGHAEHMHANEGRKRK